MTRKVAYKVRIDDLEFTSGVTSIRCESGLTGGVNFCELRFAPGGEDLFTKAGKNNSVCVELGYDELFTVFTGSAVRMSKTHETIQVVALSCFSTILQTHANLTYEGFHAGEMISDVLEKYKISEEKIETGISYPTYYFSDRSSLFSQIKTLALYSGFDFYATVTDQAVLAKYKASKVHKIHYGKEIISYEVRSDREQPQGVAVYGMSPAGSFGSDAYSWISHKEVIGRAGDPESENTSLVEPSLRDDASVEKAAKAVADKKAMVDFGELKIPGRSSIQLGEAVAIIGLNGGEGHKIKSIKHHVSREKGFVTTLNWEGK
ncbi:MAG: hypothetical protein ABUK01_00415 [Leptospirales bacterium]